MADLRLCAADGCDKPAIKNGRACTTHAGRMTRHGSYYTCFRPVTRHPRVKIGDKFAKLTVIDEVAGSKRHRYKLVCECGTTIEREAHPLRSGQTKDCGCSERGNRDDRGRLVANHIDLVPGTRFDRLVVVGNERRVDKNYVVLCRCDCGREVETRVDSLKRGQKKQCGDHARVVSDAQRAATGQKNKTHGLSKSAEYNSWVGMKARCLNPNNDRYDDYGGRGISICAEWVDSFETFLRDMGKKPTAGRSLDRINVDGNYEPKNCRWATAREQTQNRRPFVMRSKQCHIGPVERASTASPHQLPALVGRHKNASHGMSQTAEYRAWSAMQKRCHSPSCKAYRNYGARGIKVCADWRHDFVAFYSHIGPKPEGDYSLDRIDNSGGYELGNVRWSDRSTQNKNRRPFLVTPRGS
jgi:hypothetical protein